MLANKDHFRFSWVPKWGLTVYTPGQKFMEFNLLKTHKKWLFWICLSYEWSQITFLLTCEISNILVQRSRVSGQKQWATFQIFDVHLDPEFTKCENVKFKQFFILLIRPVSYTLGREYRVMRNRYSRLLFTSEDRLCANLRVQEQSTNMTSQC